MEKIGDFAKRCQTTIKTLRYYNQMGLLSPDYIDASTQYRYYGQNKIEEMRRITELKKIGFTLDEIKRYCNATPAEQRNIAEERHWALTKHAEDTASQLKKLENMMQGLQRTENKVPIDFGIPFENDERVIGRWEFVATVPKKEYFKPGGKHDNATILDELYFLPQGERYWCFGWTKGYIKIASYPGYKLLVPYELEVIDGQIFMFADNPDEGGCWVLRQADTRAYTAYEIGQWDNIDLPYVDDPAVHGIWISVDFVDEVDDFIPASPKAPYLWVKSLEFSYGGCVQVKEGDEGDTSPERQVRLRTEKWTKNKLLEIGAKNAAADYVIHKIGSADYMFFEWKTGDVVWGKLKPKFYVMKRN